MAAQLALDHYGLGLASIRDHLIVDPVAQSRSALAWWAWCLVVFAAFFVGPLSVAATQCLVANWWLLRGLRILVFGALVLGLAAIGHLPAAPSSFDVSAGAVVGAAVALLSAALAALGARSIRAAARRRQSLSGLDHGCSRAFDPVAAPPPWPGGGSVESGLALRPRQGHSLAPEFRSLGRLAFAGVLGLVVLAAVSALSGAVVALELAAPGSVRNLLARTAAPAPDPPVHAVPAPQTQASATQMRVMAFAPLPPPPAHIAIVATIPENELTFTKGYLRRRAAREAAEIVTTALQFQIKVPDKLRSRAVTLQHVEHDGHAHPPRRVSERSARDRYHGDRQAAHGSGGVHRRYVAYDPPGSHRRRSVDVPISPAPVAGVRMGSSPAPNIHPLSQRMGHNQDATQKPRSAISAASAARTRAMVSNTGASAARSISPRNYRLSHTRHGNRDRYAHDDHDRFAGF